MRGEERTASTPCRMNTVKKGEERKDREDFKSQTIATRQAIVEIGNETCP